MSILELNGPVTAVDSALARLTFQRDRPPLRSERLRLRAMVLLGGSVRSSQFAEACGRSLLDLPIDSHHSVLDLWRAHGAIHVAYSRLDRLPIRIVTNGVRPSATSESFAVAVTVERDRSELRGTGGVLHDVASIYEDDDLVAVASANQILAESLSHLLSSLEAARGDVALLAHDDGTPSGLLLARCGALRCIPSIGFVDLKEQALPLIAKTHTVKVIHRAERVALPVSTACDYIKALRQYHCRQTVAEPMRSSGQAGGTLSRRGAAFAEHWAPTFALSERGAHVDASARIHDSVVLRGAHVHAGAIVVRSVVCPGGVVGRNQTVIDELIGAGARMPSPLVR